MCDVDINVSSSSFEDGGFLLVNLTPPKNQALVALPGHGPQSSRVNESQSDVMGLPEPPLLGPPIQEKSDESLGAADEKPTHEEPLMIWSKRSQTNVPWAMPLILKV
jgi:hypothetical protein